MVDYIIVGFGIAGVSVTEELERRGKTYLVYEDSSQKASRVAAGVCNPVVLKRFTMAWRGGELMDGAISFYKGIEERLSQSFVDELPVLRRFNSVEEQNLWYEAADRPVLREFLSENILKNKNEGIGAPFYLGKVHKTHKVALSQLLSSYMAYMKAKNSLIEEPFVHDDIEILDNGVVYKGVKARHLIFSEGYGMVQNPYFNQLPLVGNKGEYVIIKSETLRLKEAIKAAFFIVPLGNDLYKIGATYDHQDKSKETTEAARDKILKKMKEVLCCEYTIVSQESGIRPTVRDRRPLVGTHDTYKVLHLLNGLGTRGVLMGPFLAKQLLNSIEKGETLEAEYNINRFA
ncbi:FAD-binding oxidoreductase [Aquimarina sp. TRL1]|uniref:NAD(P)/FAD-dependent oxidoreductase n=1 Tax=Aquimarina sp. (strain TRL1) TaxID=2736252 RepID=UPI00158E7EF4|nr:FAD-binding oxidoreductase [Aquimarina sp. TRL1]QKX04228.1 FAD-binding oxidoreductase [Aquimarina sp. TRL1]